MLPEVQYTPLLLVYAVATVVTTWLTYYSGKRLRSGWDPTVAAFVGIVFGGAVWGFTRFCSLLFVSEPLTQFWIAVLYVGYGSATLSALFFGLAFTGRTELLTRRTVGLLLAFPAVAVLAAATNQFHGALWTGTFETRSGWYGDGLVVYVREFQPLFYAYLLYTVTATLTGIGMLVRMGLQSGDVYRRQTFAFSVGGLTALSTGVLFATGTQPVVPEFVDLTPGGFTVMGLCYGYAIFRHQLLDLVPVARDSVIEGMRDGYVVLDEDDRIVDLNNAAMDVIDDEDALGNRVGDVLPACSSVVAAHEHGTRAEEEIELTTGGQQRFLLASVSSLRTDGRLMGRLLLLRDITERRAVQKRYQALIEGSSDLILVVEPDGEVAYASPSIARISGLEPSDVVGEDSLSFVHEDDRDQLSERFLAALDEPGARSRCEYRIRGASGDWLYMEATIRNELDNPYVEGIVVNSREITDRKRREQELEATNEQLTQANERLEQFASVVSHDLRNPINVARGHLDIARETGDEESFEKIDSSLQRMEAVIADVLTMAREGKSVGDVETVDLAATAEEAWSHVATGEARLDVAEDGAFEADPDRLLQLFENLFRNSVEHGPPDSSGAITVRVGVEDGTLYVEDDGSGIPEADREKVLESGFTTNTQGTGLGLSIVSQIAEAHGWEVSVSESPEGGARFEFAGVERAEVAS